VKKLAALLRLALALLRSSGFTLTHERLPDGRAKIRILRAVDRARAFVRALLRFLRLSPSRFHAWRRLQHACALDDQSSCPHTSPHRLTPPEVRAIKEMVTALEYRHVPTGTLAVLAQRLGKVWASPSTWYHLVLKFGWRRPRLRVHPAKPTVGLRTTRADEMWHIDTTVIRLLDGTRAYLHAVIDNFSRRILAWRVADTFATVNSVAVLVEASRGATPSETTPVVLADAGVENVNAKVDDLITTGVLRRVLAFAELKFSNSMIEAWWRSLKHQWLFLHSLDSVTTVRRLVEFYVQEHNRVLPHSAFRGQTPDEMYFGRGDAVPADVTCGRHAGPALRPTDRRPAGGAHQSTRQPDHRQLTAFRPGPAGPCVWRRLPRSHGRPSKRAEPCPGSALLSRARPCRLNDENSRGKFQNVRGDSSVSRSCSRRDSSSIY
jgi:putative transposase